MGVETNGTLMVGYNTRKCIRRDTDEAFRDYIIAATNGSIYAMKETVYEILENMGLPEESLEDAGKIETFHAYDGYAVDFDPGYEKEKEREPNYVGMRLCDCYAQGPFWECCTMEDIDEKASLVERIFDLCGFDGELEVVFVVGVC